MLGIDLAFFFIRLTIIVIKSIGQGIAKLHTFLIIDIDTYGLVATEAGDTSYMIFVQNVMELILPTAVSLTIIFWIYGLVHSLGDYHVNLRPENFFKAFFRLALALAAVGNASAIFKYIWNIGLELIGSVNTALLTDNLFEIPEDVQNMYLPESYKGITGITAILDIIKVDFNELLYAGFQGTIFALVLLIGMIVALVILVMLLMRIINIYMYFIVAPIGLSFTGGKFTENIGFSFVKAFIKEALRGFVMSACFAMYGIFLRTNALMTTFFFSDDGPIATIINAFSFFKGSPSIEEIHATVWCISTLLGMVLLLILIMQSDRWTRELFVM